MAHKTTSMMRVCLRTFNTRGLIIPRVQQMNSRMASTSTNLASSPIYELRMYAIHPSKFKTAIELYNKNYHLRLQHSKLFGFWTAEIGDHITQFVHIWEYESLSHRRQVRSKMAGDETWNTQFLPVLLPCVSQWKNSLLLSSPDTKINTEFTKDPSAVYILEQAKNLPDPTQTTQGDIVGQFVGILGPTNKEYRLWRYSDIDGAVESFKRVAESGAPFDGSRMLLYPTQFSPLH